jgi:hypothetical protein
MVTAGFMMLLLGIYVVRQFPEQRFLPTPQRRMRETLALGFAAAKGDRAIKLVLLVTLLVNGADEVFNRLFLGLGLGVLANAFGISLAILGVAALVMLAALLVIKPLVMRLLVMR